MDAEICGYYEIRLVVNYFKQDLWRVTATMRWITKLVAVAQPQIVEFLIIYKIYTVGVFYKKDYSI